MSEHPREVPAHRGARRLPGTDSKVQVQVLVTENVRTEHHTRVRTRGPQFTRGALVQVASRGGPGRGRLMEKRAHGAAGHPQGTRTGRGKMWSPGALRRGQGGMGNGPGAPQPGPGHGSCDTDVTLPEPTTGKRVSLGGRQHCKWWPPLSLLSPGPKAKPTPNPGTYMGGKDSLLPAGSLGPSGVPTLLGYLGLMAGSLTCAKKHKTLIQ